MGVLELLNGLFCAAAVMIRHAAVMLRVRLCSCDVVVLCRSCRCGLSGAVGVTVCVRSYGAVLGKTTPLQLVVMGICEAVFYWINVYFCVLKSEAIDIGPFRCCDPRAVRASVAEAGWCSL